MKGNFEMNMNNSGKCGLFDLPKIQLCRHPSHEFPKFLWIPQGKGYKHVCPGCGNVIEVLNP